MQKLRPALIALLLGASVLPMVSSSVSAQTCTCPGAGIRADVAPPPLPEYDQPPIPAPGYMWTPGYWAWNNYDYYWVPGTWVEPPQSGLLWTPGYWGFVDGVYLFNPGYWGPHVGFYGGVAYGFGYGGAGYEGGYWNNGAFFYNRTVNNFGPVHITNVYEKTVVVENANHVSFNGPGGTEAKPTAEEEAAAKEPHVRPTDLQTANARNASMKSDLFVSTNRGKPAIAATPKPGVFTGPGVIKAKAAGGPLVPPAAGEKPLGVEPKTEKTLQGSEIKPTPKATPALAPKPTPTLTPKPLPGAGPTGERKTPTPEAEKKNPPAPMEHKALQRVEQNRPPVVNAPQRHAPPAQAPKKPRCGVPGAPKC